MYYNVLLNIRTTREVSQLRGEVEQLLKGLFKTEGVRGWDELLKTHVRAHIADSIKADISEERVPPGQYLEGLKTELSRFKILKISMAFEPREKTISRLFLWVQQNLGDGVVIDFQRDPSLLAGAQISYEGRYFDNSLSKVYETKFAQIEDKIRKSLAEPLQ
jgi:hypothetical protein